MASFRHAAEEEAGLTRVLEELQAREPLFHRPEHGTTRADFEHVLAGTSWETGTSGQRYTRQFVLGGLDRRHAAAYEDVGETFEFACRGPADHVYLLTYTLLQNRVRLTRRVTLWQRTQQGWKAVYHPGTVVANPA